MKSLIALVIVVSALIAQPLRAETPSRTETVSWLTKKLSGYSAVWMETYTGGGSPVQPNDHRVTVKEFSIDASGLMKIEVNIENGTLQATKPWRASVVYIVSLDDLSTKGRIEPQKANPLWQPDPRPFVLTLTANKKGAVSQKSERWQWPTGPADRLDLTFTDEELVARIAKAFEHLIRLSGGKDEPF